MFYNTSGQRRVQQSSLNAAARGAGGGEVLCCAVDAASAVLPE
eukprot:gene8276-3516_t